MKVFIHSSSKDIDIVQDLAHRLEAAGVETHWANESAKSDKTISVTNRALREADEIFIILTNESVDDPNLMVALGAAYSTRRHVTPIVVGLQTSQIPSLIKSLKYIKYPDLNSYIADMASRTRAA
ncbi:MAG: TIR domain-containing protein [Pyrinomonadaceae bacterium]